MSTKSRLSHLALALIAAVVATFTLLPQAVAAKPGAPGQRGERARPMKFGEEGTEKETLPVLKIEEALGKDLTEQQKEALKQAAAKFRTGMAELEKEFVKEVSEVTGLEAKQIARLDPPMISHPRREARNVPLASFVKRLNTVLEKNLSGMQERQITRAYQDRQKDVEPLREQLTRDISDATGLSESKVERIIKPAS